MQRIQTVRYSKCFRGRCYDDPEDLMIHKEDFSHIEAEMNKVLSGLEKQVLSTLLGWTILPRNFS